MRYLFLILFFGFYTQGRALNLLNPSNNSVFSLNDTISFEWDNSGNVPPYIIQISSTIDFSNIVHTDTINNLDYPLSTLGAGIYFWRIAYLSPSLTWSSTRTFKVISILSIPNLKAWYKCDTGVISSLNKVSVWQDCSGNGNNLTQTSATRQATLVDSLFGKKLLYFDGVDDRYINQTITMNHPTNFFIVFKPFIKPGNNYFFDGIPASTMTLQTNTTSKYVLFSGSFGTINTVNAETNFNILNARYNGTQSTVRQDLIQLSPGVNSGSLSATGGFSFGSLGGINQNNPVNHSSFIVAELIIVNNALTTSEVSDIENYLKSKYAPPVSLGKDIELKYGFCNPVLKPSKTDYQSFLWSTGATTDSIIVSQAGTYWLRVVDKFGFISSDTIAFIDNRPIVGSPSVSSVCFGDSIVWTSNINTSNYSFLWNNSSTDSFLVIKNSGNYFVRVTDTLNCFVNSDTLSFQIDSFEFSNVLNDTIGLCSGEFVTINVFNENFIYNWNNNSNDTFYQAQINELIFLELINENNCRNDDTSNLNIIGLTPIVDWSYTFNCEDLPINFIDNTNSFSDTITSWLWNFNNLDSSTNQNPNFVFNAAGSYSVNLTVETNVGCVNSLEKQININSNPTADFNLDITCAQGQAQFSQLSVSNQTNPLLNYSWNLAPGLTSTDSIPNYIYPNDGIFDLSLRVTNSSGCNDSIYKTVEIFPALLPDFSFENICIGDSVEFTDETASFSIIQRTWDFGFFNQTSNLLNPKFYYPAVDTYTVRLSVINAIGCENSIEKTIIIKDLPKASALFENLCEGSESKLYDNSIFDNANLLSNSWLIEGDTFEDDTLSYVFNDAGTYAIFYEVSDENGCLNDTTLTLTIETLPEVDFSFSPDYGTAPLEVAFTNLSTNANAYTWTFDNLGASSNQSNPSFTYQENGNYTIKLIASNAALCIDSVQKSIVIIPTELDVELSNLILEKSSLNDEVLAYKASVLVRNVGSRNITNLDLLIRLNAENQLAENWVGNLDIGQAFLFEFTSFLYINNEDILEYICVEASNVNDNTELALNNNIICEIQKGLIQSSSLYPNPASDHVSLDLILASNGKLKVGVYDVKGSNVFTMEEIEAKRGYNKVLINTKNLLAGKYFVQVIYQDETYSYPLSILNR